MAYRTGVLTFLRGYNYNMNVHRFTYYIKLLLTQTGVNIETKCVNRGIFFMDVQVYLNIVIICLSVNIGHLYLYVLRQIRK